MRHQLLLSVLVLTTAAGGCHLIFPYSRSSGQGDAAADLPPRKDGLPDRAARDRRIPETVPLDKTSPVKDKPTSSWTELTVSGASWSENAVIWGESAQYMVIAVKSTIYECSYQPPATLSCANKMQLSSDKTLHDVGGHGSAIYAVGSPALVLSRADGWKTNIYDSTGRDFNGIWCTGAKQCLLGGKYTQSSTSVAMFVIYNGGAFTDQSDVVGLSAINAVWGDGAGAMVAVGGGCFIWQKISSSASWKTTMVASCLLKELRGVWGSGPKHIVAVGADAIRLVWDGSYWLVKGTATGVLNDVWGSGTNFVIAVGDAGSIYIHDGAGWTKKNVAITQDLTSVWGTGSSVYIVGDSTTAIRYTY